MSFVNPWGLLALGAIPVIIGLHLYHRRFPQMVVAGLQLWGVEQETRNPGRRRDRLPLTWSLLLELLAAVLIALLISQPQIRDLTTVDHLVIVLDDSASMQARLEADQTVRDRAVEVIEQRMSTLGKNTVCTLLLSGPRPASLTGAPVEWEEAEELLAAWQPTQTHHDVQSSWDVAAQVAGETGHLLFLTNRLPSEELVVPARMEIEALGRPRDNLALDLARWRSSDDGGAGQLHVRVSNPSGATRSVNVIAESAGTTVVNQRLTVPARSSRSLDTAVSGGGGRLDVRIEGSADALDIDNQVVLLEPRQREIAYRIKLDQPDERVLFERVLESAEGLVEVDSDEAAQLIIDRADGERPEREHVWWLGVGPVSSSEEAQSEALDLGSPFLLERRSPLLEGVVLGGIVWGGAQPLPFEVEPLVTSDRLPLYGKLVSSRSEAYVLNLDLTRTNLTATPDWPVLVTNFIELCRDDQSGFPRWNYRLNEVVRARIPRAAGSTEPLTLIQPDGAQRVIARDRRDTVEIRGLDQPGIYRLQQGERVLERFSVNFYDPVESDLTRLESGLRAPDESADADYRSEGAYNWLMRLGVILVAGCLLGDWIVLKREAGGV